MWRNAAEYVGSLGLDAWLVGGAVRDDLLGNPIRDTDFVVPGVGHEGLRAALAPHGKVEDLTVAGRHVGVRLYPSDPEARALAPAGIEFAPPRVERSTGPGRHDFEIVADGDLPLEEDMRRRDFTINAIAKRLSTGEVLDPLGGEEDLRRRILRTTSPTSFRDDPLRIVRGLRFVSQLDLDPDEETLAQMREWAPQVRLVSAERIGGGLAADGLGELSKLLLGAKPAKALRLARDTGVLAYVLPECEDRFEAVQEAADAGAPLQVRLALLLDDSAPALSRLRYPTELCRRVRDIVQGHDFELPDRDDAAGARRFLAGHGWSLAQDLLAHKEAELRAADEDLEALDRFRRLLERERESPHRLSDLALGGDELIELGYRPGPQLGQALQRLLDEVVEDPSRNTKEWLSARARELA